MDEDPRDIELGALETRWRAKLLRLVKVGRWTELCNLIAQVYQEPGLQNVCCVAKAGFRALYEALCDELRRGSLAGACELVQSGFCTDVTKLARGQPCTRLEVLNCLEAMLQVEPLTRLINPSLFAAAAENTLCHGLSIAQALGSGTDVRTGARVRQMEGTAYNSDLLHSAARLLYCHMLFCGVDSRLEPHFLAQSQPNLDLLGDVDTNGAQVLDALVAVLLAAPARLSNVGMDRQVRFFATCAGRVFRIYLACGTAGLLDYACDALKIAIEQNPGHRLQLSSFMLSYVLCPLALAERRSHPDCRLARAMRLRAGHAAAAPMQPLRICVSFCFGACCVGKHPAAALGTLRLLHKTGCLPVLLQAFIRGADSRMFARLIAYVAHNSSKEDIKQLCAAGVRDALLARLPPARRNVFQAVQEHAVWREESVNDETGASLSEYEDSDDNDQTAVASPCSTLWLIERAIRAVTLPHGFAAALSSQAAADADGLRLPKSALPSEVRDAMAVAANARKAEADAEAAMVALIAEEEADKAKRLKGRGSKAKSKKKAPAKPMARAARPASGSSDESEGDEPDMPLPAAPLLLPPPPSTSHAAPAPSAIAQPPPPLTPAVSLQLSSAPAPAGQPRLRFTPTCACGDAACTTPAGHPPPRAPGVPPPPVPQRASQRSTEAELASLFPWLSMTTRTPARECVVCMDSEAATSIAACACGETVCNSCAAVLLESANPACPRCRMEARV